MGFYGLHSAGLEVRYSCSCSRSTTHVSVYQAILSGQTRQGALLCVKKSAGHPGIFLLWLAAKIPLRVKSDWFCFWNS